MDDVELLLATLNTTPVDDGHRQDHLCGEAGISWLTARGLPDTPYERDSLVAARDRLQELVRDGGADGGLAAFLDGVRDVPVLEDGALRWERRLPSGRGLAARIVIAFAELEHAHPHRVRACASPDCDRFLVDRSRSNHAKWCSMATCGNRAKARRHYQRARAGA